MRQRLHHIGFYAILFVVIAASAELTARVEDFIRRGVPMLSTPDRDRDLVLHDSLGIRGRPNGRYGRWQLNSAGFRGPEIAKRPVPGCHRIVVLGASESFGLYESDGHDYSTQLNDRLRGASCYEVVNASLFGLTLPALTRIWESWVREFGSQTVIVYPTPAFYLNDRPPAPPGAPPASDPAAPWWTPRLLGRAEDLIEYPAFVQRRRVARDVAQLEAAHDAAWFYDTVPADRLAMFERDLDALVAAIAAAGATPVLVTHATGFHRPPSPSQHDALVAWRLLIRKPRGHVLIAFEDATRAATLEIGKRRGIVVVDAAAMMNGRPEWFAADLLHFNDAGAATLAAALASHFRDPEGSR